LVTRKNYVRLYPGVDAGRESSTKEDVSVTESRSRHCEGWNEKIQGDTQWVEVVYKREEEEEEEEEEEGRQLRDTKNVDRQTRLRYSTG
jgi:hypothetical protein